jgi:hypothetical protein
LRFGLATDTESTRDIVLAQPSYADVVLIPRSVLSPKPTDLPLQPDTLLMTHSGLRSGLGAIESLLIADRKLAGMISDRLDSDVTNRSNLVQLLLAMAVHDNPKGITLFSSSSAAHIEANAQATAKYSVGQLTGVRRVLSATADAHPMETEL